MLSIALNRVRACAGLLSVALLLGACGGGGGGSDVNVALDRSAVSYSYAQDSAPPTEAVVATVSGANADSLPATLFARVTVEGEGLDSTLPITINGLSARVALKPREGLAPGSYSGRVLLSACADAACGSIIGGAALPVAWSITVTPIFKAGVSVLEPAFVDRTGASAALPVQLPPGASSFSASVVGSADWLQLGTPSSSSLPVTFKPWRSGTYNASVALVAAGQTLQVPVRYVVPVPPGGENDLLAAPTQVTLSASENTRAATKAVVLSLPSWGSPTDVALRIDYANGGPSGWLEVTRSATGMNVAHTTSTMTKGVYLATIVVTPALPGTAVGVPVRLTVGSGLVAPAPLSLTVTADTTTEALNGSAAVSVTAGAAVNWTAASNAAWLRLITASGSTGQALSYNLDAAALQTLANGGTLSGRITVTPQPTFMSPVAFDVNVTKRLPEVHFIGPATVVAGQANTLHIQGSGFDGVTDLLARLRVGGYTPTAVTRLSNAELRAELPAMVAEEVTVRLSNALELTSASTTLRAVAARDFSAAAVASTGAKRSLVYEPRSQALFAANVGTGELTRLRFNGSAWVLTSLPLPGILGVGLSPDGASVVVTQTPGQLTLIDPVSLDATATLATPWPLLRGTAFDAEAIPVTHDGLSWLGSETRPDSLSSFNHRSRGFQRRPDGPNTSLLGFDEPLMAAARDGSRLLVGFELNSSPLLAYSVTDPVLRSNTLGREFARALKLSDSGARALLDHAEVRDRDFALVGRATLPANAGFTVVSSALSPDGRRAYVLAVKNEVLSSNSETSPGAWLPRVYVFDSSTLNPATSALPLLGQFDLPQYPSCRVLNASNCSIRPRSAISPDGRTLFFAGDQAFVVMPVPANLR